MKLLAGLSVTLGVMLLLSTMANVSYADNNVKVYAKEVQGKILLLVRNTSDFNLHELTIALVDGKIDSARSKGWYVSYDSINQITVSANSISPNGKETFLINTKNINSIISLTAKDGTGSIVAVDNTRAVLKRTLNNMYDLDTLSTKMTLVTTVTTDKIFYNKGEKMLISGVLKPNSDIIITIYTPSGQNIMIGEKTDQNGNFKALHVLHDVDERGKNKEMIGTYIVNASEPIDLFDNFSYVETTFKVI